MTQEKYEIKDLWVPKNIGVLDESSDNFVRYCASLGTGGKERALIPLSGPYKRGKAVIRYDDLNLALSHLRYVLGKVSNGKIKPEEVKPINPVRGSKISLGWEKLTTEEFDEFREGLGRNELSRLSGSCSGGKHGYRKAEGFPDWGIVGNYFEQTEVVNNVQYTTAIYEVRKSSIQNFSVVKALITKDLIPRTDVKLKGIDPKYLRNVNLKDVGMFDFEREVTSREEGPKYVFDLKIPVLSRDESEYSAQNALVARELIRSARLSEKTINNIKSGLSHVSSLEDVVGPSDKGLSLKIF